MACEIEKSLGGKNPRAIPPLFAKNFRYFEDPFQKPLTSKKALIALWQDVPKSQKEVKFKFNLLSNTNNQYLAHFQASFIRLKTGKKALLDGIFYFKLNNNSLCTFFRWWWNTKENSQ